MFKAFNQLLPKNLQKYFVKTLDHGYDMKNKDNFYQKFARTKKKQLCISISGVKIWNSINGDQKHIKTLVGFKKMYKNKFIS